MTEYIFFNEKKYSIDKTHGYWRSTDRAHTALHRDIWKFYNGEVPEGYDIHHRDFNPLNNELSNLQCLTHAEHLRIHTTERRKAGTLKAKLERNVPIICAQCGKEFLARKKNAKFCSPLCNQHWQRDNGHRHVIRICDVCGKEFLSFKYSYAKYCSHECVAIGNGTAKLTDEQRAYIRQMHKPRDKEFGTKALAVKFGVTSSAISYIIHH